MIRPHEHFSVAITKYEMRSLRGGDLWRVPSFRISLCAVIFLRRTERHREKWGRIQKSQTLLLLRPAQVHTDPPQGDGRKNGRLFTGQLPFRRPEVALPVAKNPAISIAPPPTSRTPAMYAKYARRPVSWTISCAHNPRNCGPKVRSIGFKLVMARIHADPRGKSVAC